MQYFLLAAVIALVSLQNVFQKQYPKAAQTPNVFLFGSISSLTALVFFVFSSGFKLEFTTAFLPYSVAFGLVYAAASIGNVLSLKLGSLALTSLITSYSLLIPTLYGVLFLKESVGLLGYIGIVLLIVSIFLLNAKKEQVTISAKWIIAVAVTFVTNGLCSVFQKMEQMRFDGGYKSEFMIVALGIVAVILFVMAFFQKGSLKKEAKIAVRTAAPNGLANGVVNFLVMVLTGVIPNAILFPGISAGGIVLSWILATFVYKEKLSKVQLAGYVIGIASVICLNL